MTNKERLETINLVLPKAPNPVGAYLGYKKVGNLVFISGQVSFKDNGSLIKGKLGSFAVAAALLLRENKKYVQHKDIIESTVITYLKDNNLYDDILNESREIPEVLTDDKFVMNCFGVDVFENNGELKSEFDYAKTL